MHYYSFNIGDYARDTLHLSEMEDLAYRRIIDLYYSRELPLPDDISEIARLIRMRTHCDCIAAVLKDFFSLESDGYHQLRIDTEIHDYKEKSAKASKSAKTRWKKAKAKQKVTASCERIANAVQTQCEGNAKQEPITINQETIKPLSKHTLDDEVFAKGMFTLILKVAEKTRKPDFSKWANVIRLMREVDGLELSEMADVFRWANRDEFWQTNILSATKFRKQFSTLHAKMTGEQNGNNQSSNRSSNGSRLSTIEQSSAVNRANHERTLREIAELEAQIDHERTLGSAES